MMTLDEAIKHCKDVALSCTNKECALEHFQLLKWLQEYSNMLKKQVNQKPQGKSALEASKEEKVDNQNCVKPADKVKPKFHDGDWAVSNLDGKARQISEVHFDEYNSYYVVDGKSVNLEEYDRLHHLWTIQDANDGDVLSYRDGQWIFIYKKQVDDNSFHYYSLYSTIHQDLTIDDSAFTLLIDGIVPATKEQRNILFQKMKEKGYKWDAKKKELKKIEQKLVDKVEPKFNVGDWIVQKGLGIYKIVEVCESWYEVISYNDGIQYSIGFDKENDCHLWTIQDAKDGDVLVNWNNTAFIFKTIEDETVKFHIAYNEKWDAIKTPSTKLSHLGLSEPQFEFHPATKEQRDLLFQEMKKAGYEWDAEKMKLKKISQRMISAEVKETMYDKPEWSEEDEKYLSYAIIASEQISHPNTTAWLKSLKERVQPQSKQEWSEEDKKMFVNIKACLRNANKDYSREVDWLKSIKPQPKNEWSEENEEHIKSLLERLEGMCKKGATFIRTRFAVSEDEDWLKHLKDRYTWKPSDEQM